MLGKSRNTRTARVQRGPPESSQSLPRDEEWRTLEREQEGSRESSWRHERCTADKPITSDF